MEQQVLYSWLNGGLIALFIVILVITTALMQMGKGPKSVTILGVLNLFVLAGVLVTNKLWGNEEAIILSVFYLCIYIMMMVAVGIVILRETKKLKK